MRKRWVFGMAAVAFFVTLVLHAPAALLYAWTQKQPSALRLHGVYGSLSQGGFAALSVNNRTTLRDGRWTLQPGWLALLRVAVDIEAGDEVVLRSRVSRAPFGALRLSSVSSVGSARSLLQLVGQPALPVEGQARLDLPLLRIKDGTPIEVEGSLEVENLAWTLSREPLPLGSFNAALNTDDKGIQVNFGSGPGPLEVGGTATLDAEKAYELDLWLRPKADAPPQLATLVRSVGPVDSLGWHHLRRKGTLQ